MPAAERDGQALHPGEHGTGQRAQQQARPERLAAGDSPLVGWVRIAVNADSAPAIAHASVDIRPAKTPAIRAASGLARRGPDGQAERALCAGSRRSRGRRPVRRKSIPEYAGGDTQRADVERRQPGRLREDAPGTGLALMTSANSDEELADAQRRHDRSSAAARCAAAGRRRPRRPRRRRRRRAGQREGEPVGDVPPDRGDAEERGAERADLRRGRS